EAALGKKLVDQDGADGVGLLVRLEIEKAVRHGPPHARRLVRLAGVGGDEVVKDWLDGPGHFRVRDGDEVIVHGWVPRESFAKSEWRYLRTRALERAPQDRRPARCSIALRSAGRGCSSRDGIYNAAGATPWSSIEAMKPGNTTTARPTLEAVYRRGLPGSSF